MVVLSLHAALRPQFGHHWFKLSALCRNLVHEETTFYYSQRCRTWWRPSAIVQNLEVHTHSIQHLLMDYNYSASCLQWLLYPMWPLQGDRLIPWELCLHTIFTVYWTEDDVYTYPNHQSKANFRVYMCICSMFKTLNTLNLRNLNFQLSE